MRVFTHNPILEEYHLEAVTGPDGRFYTTPDGNKYESITTALSRWGDKTALIKWRQRVGEKEANRITRVASSRGTGMHEIAENYLNNKKEYTKGFMPDAIELFRSIQPILDTIPIVIAQEIPLFANKYRLAGRVDCIAEIGNKLTVVDFKTSRKRKKRKWIHNYFLQCAAYSFMIEEMYGMRVEQNIIIIAVEGDKPQIFISDPYKYLEDDFFVQRLDS